MKSIFTLLQVALFSVFIVFLSGCSSKSPAALSNVSEQRPAALSFESKNNQQSSKELLSINSVYIAPPVFAGPSVEADPSHVKAMISEAFSAESSMSLVKDKSDITSRSICEGARIANADSCLVITIDNYTERAGSAMAATKLSQVSYLLELVRISDKKVVFMKSFDFHDQSLTENLLSAEDTIDQKGGSAGYATAASVFSRSIRKVFRELDELRTKQFLIN
jgi:hypothetical protein